MHSQIKRVLKDLSTNKRNVATDLFRTFGISTVTNVIVEIIDLKTGLLSNHLF